MSAVEERSGRGVRSVGLAALALVFAVGASPALARHSGSSHHSGGSSSHHSSSTSHHSGASFHSSSSAAFHPVSPAPSPASPGSPSSGPERFAAVSLGGSRTPGGGPPSDSGSRDSWSRGADGSSGNSGGSGGGSVASAPPPSGNPGGSPGGGVSGTVGNNGHGDHDGNRGDHDFRGGNRGWNGSRGTRGYFNRGHVSVGFRYPVGWGSIFFGFPDPFWWYGPWGWGGGYYGGYYGGGYYGGSYEREHDDQGALDLDLSPADTKVYLDGEYVGTVDDFDGWPQYLWLDPGTYDIVFYREGYKTLARQVTIHRGLVIDWDDKLEKGESIRPEDLPAKTHERRDARVEQDREMRDRSARDRSDRPDRWRDRVRDQRSGPGAPPAGEANACRLRLSVEPHDASVYLDGRFIGTADDLSGLRDGLLVDAGAHTLSVVRPGHKAEERKIDLKPGDGLDVRIELKAE